MNADFMFDVFSALVLPAWFLLVFFPSWRWTEKLVFHAWIPSLIAVAYIYCLYMAQPSPEGAGFGSLNAVMMLFQSPYAVLAGWIHYLAFDLFVGAWEVRDARRRSIHHLVVVPCLVLTFLAGPVGLLLYFVARFIKDRSLTTSEVLA